MLELRVGGYQCLYFQKMPIAAFVKGGTSKKLPRCSDNRRKRQNPNICFLINF